MLFITGDTHGNFQRFSTKHFPEQKEMNRKDYVLVCGDFGGIWSGSKQEEYWLDWLENKPFTTLFIDGNHENFDRLSQYPMNEWHGGKVHFVRSHVLHLMRGQIYEIDGYTFFTMGGAASHDIQDGILDPNDPNFELEYWMAKRMHKMCRVKGISWWSEEMPSQLEYSEAEENLKNVNYEVDYIISHCCATSTLMQLNPEFRPDQLTDFLESIKRKTKYHYWLFGHYHDNKVVDKRHILLWEQIVQAL